MKKALAIVLIIIGFYTESFCQQKEKKVVQFSGYTVTVDSLIGVPFVHITVIQGGRVSMAGPDGYFSFPVVEGDSLYFSSIGYRSVLYVVPKIENDKFWVVQLLARSEEYLPTTIIYPWGGPENFPKAFLDTRLPDDDLERARKNLESKTLAELAERLDKDGQEAAELNLRMQSAKKYYYGQTAPQNIFNPLAWAEFIKAWKRGDFKKQDTKPASEEK